MKGNFYQCHHSDFASSLIQHPDGFFGIGAGIIDTGNYPGANEMAEGLRHISVLLNDKESYRFINRLKELKNTLLDFAEDFHDIDTFYKTQRPVWEKLRKEYGKFQLNKFELEKDAAAAAAPAAPLLIIRTPIVKLFVSEPVERNVSCK